MNAIGKYGRHMGKSHLSDRLLLAPRLTDPFPYVNPDSTFDGTSGIEDLPDLGNLLYGCCVWVDYVYSCAIIMWLSGALKPGVWDLSVLPNIDQVLTNYFIYQGSPKPTDYVWSQQNGYDNGADEGDALLYFSKNKVGPLDELAAFVELPTEGELYEGAIQTFGVVTDDILVSSEMQQEFQNNQPWASLATDWVGGHSTANSYRSPAYAKTATWLKQWQQTWPNRRLVLEQGWLLLTKAQLDAQKFFDGAKLQADVATLADEQGVTTGGSRRDSILLTKDRLPSVVA